MKSILIIVLIMTIGLMTDIYSQNIKAKLAGHLATNGFTVVDDQDKVLFKVTGEGNVGINTNDPSALFDVKGGISASGVGRDISILAENGAQGGAFAGGNILLKSGTGSPYGDPSQIFMSGGNDGRGGSVNIYSGHGSDYGGEINIISSVGGLFPDGSNNVLNKTTNVLSEIKVGDINIGTDPSSNLFGGKISIFTGSDNVGGGDIEIRTGDSGGEGNRIMLKTGSGNGSGDIILNAGGDEDGNGEDIVLIPSSNGGLVKVNGSGTFTGVWSQASDERFKKDIKPLENVVEKLEQLNGVSYVMKSEEFPEKNFSNGRQIGLIAQQVEKIFPELVVTDDEGYKSVAYQNMVAVLLEAVKEQQNSIDDLKKEIKLLKNTQKIEVTSNTNSDN